VADATLDEAAMLATFCYEIRQPLTYLIASLDSLRHAWAATSSEATARVLGWIDRASAGARHIDTLVRDAEPVFTVTRAQLIDLARLVDGALDIVEAEVQRRARLERALAPVAVFADATRLRQLILNLIMNAWMALPDGDADLHRIRVRVARRDGRAVLEVEDSGVADELGRAAAEPFFVTQHEGPRSASGWPSASASCTAARACSSSPPAATAELSCAPSSPPARSHERA
jgi:C4-dicarboxylate-specific signal transduction histidine kinase